MITGLDKGVRADGRAGRAVLDGSHPMPVCLLVDSHMEHNARHMREFLDATGVELYPHGKTTMSPSLWRRQLADGCSGITLATFHQLRIARAHGIESVLYGNELVGDAEVEWVRGELAADPAWQLTVLVDSEEGARRLAGVPVDVLLEVGVAGARCGVRDVDGALRVADALASVDGPRLVGVEGFEGVVQLREDADAVVRNWFALFAEIALTLDGAGHFDACDEVVLTAGGTTYYPMAAEMLSAVQLSRPARLIVRSGCYLTHDSKLYERLAPEGYRASIEVWAHVLSIPEPGLAILSAGRRDYGQDSGDPVPIKAARPGDVPRPLDDSYAIVGVSDQHTHLRVPDGHGLELGDLVALSPSHPCTTFDKWRVIHVVDDDYRVVESLETFF